MPEEKRKTAHKRKPSVLDTQITAKVNSKNKERYLAAATAAGIILSDWIKRVLDEAAPPPASS